MLFSLYRLSTTCDFTGWKYGPYARRAQCRSVPTDRNERGLVSHRQEAVNSPGFWASIISGDCSWTSTGSTDSFCHREKQHSPGAERQHRCLPAYLLVMCELGSPKCRVPTGGRTAGSSELAACLHLFIYLSYLRGFVNTCKVGGFYPPHSPPPPSLPKGWGLSKGHTLRILGVDWPIVMGLRGDKPVINYFLSSQ